MKNQELRSISLLILLNPFIWTWCCLINASANAYGYSNYKQIE
jgi:hypothetical protein